MREKESGESSPLSSIEDIRRRLVRPSQDSSFRYPIADPQRRDDRKTCESLTITKYSSYARSEFADGKFEDPKCLEKLANVYVISGDQIADLIFLEDREGLLKSPTVDDLNVDDSALLTADFVDESFKEHQLFLYSESVPWKSDDLISGSTPQEDAITRSDGYLVSDLKGCRDVKRIESSKAKCGRFNYLITDSEPESHEEPRLLERLLNAAQFSSDTIADLKTKKLLKSSEKTPMILEQVGDPGPCQHLKHPEEDAPNPQDIGDFVSNPDAPEEEERLQKPRKRARREEKERARLEDYLHPSLLSAAASKMKKAIFEWPTEELRTLADSGGGAGDGGDLRAGFDSFAFRRFDDLVLKLFHA